MPRHMAYMAVCIPNPAKGYVPPWQGHFAVQGERAVLMFIICVQVNANYQATLSGNKNAIISYPAS